MSINKLVLLFLACLHLYGCKTGSSEIPSSNFKRAQKEIYLGNYSDARKYLNESLREATFRLHRGEITYWAGYTYLREKNYSLATGYFKNADVLYTAGALKGQILTRLVCSLIEESKIEEAKTYALKAEKLNVAEIGEIKHVMAKYYYEKDDLDKAKVLYKEVASKNTVYSSDSVEKLSVIAEGNFYLQVGLFTSKENVDNILRKLKNEYYLEPYVVEEIKDRSRIYSVRVGKFKTRNEAELKMRELTRRYNNLGLIVKP